MARGYKNKAKVPDVSPGSGTGDSVLQDPRPPTPQGNGGRRIFGTPTVSDDQRAGSLINPQILDASGGSVRTELLRLLTVSAADLQRMEIMDSGITVGQALARVLLKRAIVDQNQAALTDVLDRIEGKAGRAAPNKGGNSHLDDQIDNSIESLDSLTPKSEE